MIIQSVLFLLFLIVYGFHSIQLSDLQDVLLFRRTVRIKTFQPMESFGTNPKS